VVNFAQGAFPVLAGLTAASLLGQGLPHGAAEIVAILVAGVAGLVVGIIAIGKRGTPVLSSLVITLGLGILAYAIEIIIFGDQPISFSMLHGSVDVAGARISWQYLLVIAVTLLAFAGLGLLFARTYIGKALSACASNPYAARLSGIDPTRMGLVAFGLGGLLGGLAGVLITPLQPVAFDSDVLLAINGFAAAIVGGLNSPGAALAGGLGLGVVQAMIAGYFDASYQSDVALVLIIIVMLYQASRRSTLSEEIA
jgi:branched-chain amino acid transport system permease protein